MVEFYVIINHTTTAIHNMRKIFEQLHLNIEVLELREAPILDKDGNEKKMVFVLDCFGSFDYYVRLRVSHDWQEVKYENKISLIA